MPVPDQTSTLDAALSYAKRGWRVIPIAPGTKYPQGLGRWQDAATTDPETIRGWWTGKFAGYGVGIATGPESGIFVTDIDVSDGKRGDDSLRYLIDDHRGVWPDTVHDMTPTGGSHYFFKYPTDGREIRNEAGVRLGPGIDVRGIGGQVLAPPTLHPVTGTAYCWEDGFGPDEIEVAEPPEWLLRDLCDPLPAAAPQPAAATPLMVAEADGPARRFNEATTWDQLLTKDGWVLDHTDRDGEQHWVRPGKDPRHGTSATVLHEGRDTLKVFTDGVAFLEQEKAYSRFGYLACRDFGGDRSACAKWLRAQEDERQRAEDRAFLAPYPRAGLAPAPVNGSQANIELLEHVSTNGNGNGDRLDTGRRVVGTRASSIEMRPVRWVWGDRIPLGEITLLAGREGIGKSLIGYDLAASLTRGALPGTWQGTATNVLVAASEDSWEHTIIPRLRGARADLDRITRVDVKVEEFSDLELEVDLPVDIPGLQDLMMAESASMLILDPLISRLAATIDTHKDAPVRRALEPLKKLASNTGAAILGLIHVNKSSGTDPTNMVMGSRAFTATARSVLFAFADVSQEDETLKAIGLGKSNLGRLDIPTILYHIQSETVGHFDGQPITTGVVKWVGEVDKSIREIAEEANEDPEERGALADACAFVTDCLKSHGGKYSSAEIKREGKEHGLSQSAIDRARRKLRLGYEKAGNATYWMMPKPKADLRSLVTPSSDAVDVDDAYDVNDAVDAEVGSLRTPGSLSTTSSDVIDVDDVNEVDDASDAGRRGRNGDDADLRVTSEGDDLTRTKTASDQGKEGSPRHASRISGSPRVRARTREAAAGSERAEDEPYTLF